MNIRLKLLTPIIAALTMASPAVATASPADTLRVSGGWYGGVEGGVPFGVGVFSSFGADKTRAGYTFGLYGGYRFSHVLSAELSAKWGRTNLSARDCCANSDYWLGSDGVRYYAPVAGMDGWDYADIKSNVGLGQYGARLNVNILGFFSATRTSRWTLDVSPALYAVGTKAAIKTIAENNKVFRHDRKWHLGYGGRLQAGYRITRNIGVGIYSEITALTGKNLDGMPEYKHNSNLVWESGVRIGWTFGKSDRKKTGGTDRASHPAISQAAVESEETKRPTGTTESAQTDAVTVYTPIDTTTEIAGSKQETATAFPEVYFAFNSHAIRESEQPKLQTILNLLNESPRMKVTLNGWCDSEGGAAVNKRISLQRAETVKAWLVDHGVSADRITTVGNGSERNEADASKARRVVIETERKEAQL